MVIVIRMVNMAVMVIRTGISLKLDFPGNLCRSAFAIVVMILSAKTKAVYLFQSLKIAVI